MVSLPQTELVGKVWRSQHLIMAVQLLNMVSQILYKFHFVILEYTFLNCFGSKLSNRSEIQLIYRYSIPTRSICNSAGVQQLRQLCVCVCVCVQRERKANFFTLRYFRRLFTPNSQCISCLDVSSRLANKCMRVSHFSCHTCTFVK